MKLANLKKGEYFQVGLSSHRQTFRIIRMTVMKIYLLNESFKIHCHEIEHLDDLYSYEEYNLQKITQQEGQDLFLSLIDKKILMKKALIAELKKTKNSHTSDAIKRNQLELRKLKSFEKRLKK